MADIITRKTDKVEILDSPDKITLSFSTGYGTTGAALVYLVVKAVHKDLELYDGDLLKLEKSSIPLSVSPKTLPEYSIMCMVKTYPIAGKSTVLYNIDVFQGIKKIKRIVNERSDASPMCTWINTIDFEIKKEEKKQ